MSRIKKSVWEPEWRYCSAGHAGVLLRNSLGPKNSQLLIEDDNIFQSVAATISVCMQKNDQDDGVPLFREEAKRARESVTYLQGILGILLNRSGDSKRNAEIALATRDEKDFWTFEVEGEVQLMSRLAALKESLDQLAEFFHPDQAKPTHWHLLAQSL